jgi:recombination protein RecT
MKTNGSDQETKGKPKQEDSVKTLQERIKAMAKQFEAALPKTITPERMMRIVLTTIRQNPKLAACPEESFFGAVLTALQLGLEPNTPLGQCYLIPYAGEINFQIGYQGLLELAYRSNKYRRIDAEVVYKGDKFEFSYGLNAVLKHKPCGIRDEPVYVYALYELVNGGQSFKVWTWDAVIRHGQVYSKSYDSSFSPWSSKEKETVESMAKKTLLVNLLKYAPKSVEVSQAISADEADIKAKVVGDGNYSFVDYEIIHNNRQLEAPNDELKPPPQRPPNAQDKPDPVPARNQQAGKSTATSSQMYSEEEDAALEEIWRRDNESGDNGPDFNGGR